jgi:formimidoylglutamate deiminase
MVAAGYTAVGEFHYPHHQPGGEPYPDPERDGQGHRRRPPPMPAFEIVMLMTAYARAGWGLPPTPGQRRFCDADVASYLARVDCAGVGDARGAGSAQRAAVPRDWLDEITAYAASQRHGRATSTPTSSGARSTRAWRSTAAADRAAGRDRLLGPRATVIHATHVVRARS